MNKNANYIRNRLSLRKPQEDSLYILSELVDKLELRKSPLSGGYEEVGFLEAELKK